MTLESFEEEAEKFYKATGYLRPGKDVPAAIWHSGYEEERIKAWERWLIRNDPHS